MTERQIITTIEKPESTFLESFRVNSPNLRQRQALRVLDKLESKVKLSDEQKRLLFYQHLFHEEGSYWSIKKFSGLKNDRLIREMLDNISDNQELVDSYETFYIEYGFSRGKIKGTR